jgi:hypothetical protein
LLAPNYAFRSKAKAQWLRIFSSIQIIAALQNTTMSNPTIRLLQRYSLRLPRKDSGPKRAWNLSIKAGLHSLITPKQIPARQKMNA